MGFLLQRNSHLHPHPSRNTRQLVKLAPTYYSRGLNSTADLWLNCSWKGYKNPRVLFLGPCALLQGPVCRWFSDGSVSSGQACALGSGNQAQRAKWAVAKITCYVVVWFSPVEVHAFFCLLEISLFTAKDNLII